MATRKPKVGDAAIIDGSPYVLAEISDKSVEFHCLHRAALRAELAEVRAIEDPAKAQEAKEAFMEKHEFEPMDQDMKVRLQECGHNHLIPGGSSFYCTPDKVFWVAYGDGTWSAFGRLLERNQELDSEFHTIEEYLAICLTEDKTPDPNYGTSVKSRAKLFRHAGQPYDPTREVAAHIAHVSQMEA